MIYNMMYGGGGTPTIEKKRKDVNFFDYDGTIVESYTVDEWDDYIPSNPAHDGLISQGWNYTLAEINQEVTAQGKCDIGQMYITDDDTTRLYVHMAQGRLHPYLYICPNGTVVVDWGDNSATSTLTGTSLTTAQVADHEYASSGDYVITFTVSSGTFQFYGNANTAYILRNGNSTQSSAHRVYSNSVKKIELGANVSIGNYAFNYCYSLASITIPCGITSIGTGAFSNCQNLASVTIPSIVTSLGNNAFNQGYALKIVSIPKSVTVLNNNTFNGCYSITSVTIPSSITSLDSNTFNNCYSLANLTVPSGVTSIGIYAFNSCPGMGEYHFLPSTPPTLASTNAFNDIQSDCTIYVPSASENAYKTATNWSTYASQIVGE